MNAAPVLNRFKKHYSRYLIGIIVPALINGLSIPVFKTLLGAAAYGQYALYFNALLIANLLASGWLSQGVLRFYAKAGDKMLFTKQVFLLSAVVGAISFLPAGIIVWWQSGQMLTGILFGLALLLAIIQLPLQSVTQSGFLSKAVIAAEAIRTISWFAISCMLIKWGSPFLPSLFGSLALSYLFSILFLYRKNKLRISSLFIPKGSQHLYKALARYGWPFSLWFIAYYLTAYIDKVLVLQHFGPVVQGHYNALFDFLFKSLGLALAPVTIAAVPLLMEAFENDRSKVAVSLLKKLVLWEAASLILLLLLYLLFGYKILFYLLHIPFDKVYIYAGLLIITGTMVWQIAILVHKPFELNLRSKPLLFKMGVAIGVQVLFYYLPFFKDNVLKFPAGYCLAAFTYLVLVFVSVYKSKIKKTGFCITNESSVPIS